jgi:hypothetical protein
LDPPSFEGELPYQIKAIGRNPWHRGGSDVDRFEHARTRGRPKPPKPPGQRGVKTPYTAEWYAAINSWNESPRDAIPRNNNDKKRNDQSSKEQQAEDKKPYASYGFERIFCAYRPQ